MAVLDIQRRGQQIGRLRIGQQVQASNGKMRPARLDTFRFTTGSRTTAEAIAAVYGGDIREWNGEYEVITGQSVIGVTIPPRDEVISQHYEMWTKGGCQRRCDSQHEQISGGPCLCPHAENPGDPDEVTERALERSRLASMNPPKACKLVTRVNVMVPDLPGLGVFRLDTGSYYAAVEMGDTAGLMQMARDRGVFLPAQLRIEHRQRVAGGQTKKFPVPVLEVMASVRDLVTGAIEAGGMAAQLPPAPGARLALTAAASRPPAPQQATAREMTAQQYADAATLAKTRAEVRQLFAKAEEAGSADDLVCTDPAEDVYESLRDWLTECRDRLPPDSPPQQRRAPRQEPPAAGDGGLWPSDDDAPPEDDL